MVSKTIVGKPARVLVAALMASGLCSTAAADEISDLKAMVNQLMKRIEQLETNQATATAAAPAPAVVAAPAVAAAPANTVAVHPGFQVRLYGRGDLGFTSSAGSEANGSSYTTNRIKQGQMAARLGLTGSYQIDPNYRAIFGVESGLDMSNGNAGGGIANSTNGALLFNRGAVVGLAAKDYGSVEAGLMYMAPFWVMLAADNMSANNYGLSDYSALFSLSRPEAMGRYLKGSTGSSLNTNNTGTAGFYANSLRYRTPAVGAFSGEFSYSMGQQAAGRNALKDDGNSWAFNVQYKDGPLYLGYGHINYQQVNDVAAAVAPGVSRDQTTDIVGARYAFGPLTLGGSYTQFAVSNAGGYTARAYGLSSAYDFGKHRIELSAARVSYDGATGIGAYGANGNATNGKGDPSSNSYGLGYLYNVSKAMSYYTYYQVVNNNSGANLGTNGYRGDNAAFGFSPNVWTAGMFLTF